MATKSIGLILALCGAGLLQAQPVSNIIIGGGMLNCSSFNGAVNSVNCAKPWADILKDDPALAGLSAEQMLFDRSFALPALGYRIDPAGIKALNALPATLLPDASKARLTAQLNARLADPAAPKTGLSFAAFDAARPLFADGMAFWNGGHHADWLQMVATLCGGLDGDAPAAAANGAPCRLSDAAIARVAATPFNNADDHARVLLILRDMQRRLGSGELLFRRDAAGNEAKPNLRHEFRRTQLAKDGSPPSATLSAGLTPTELAALRHSFVEPLPAGSPPRKVQARSVAFLANPPALDIYREFVQAASNAAGGKTPTIGLVTAAGRNPYTDHDLNYYALRSAGAQVVWLPADGGMRRAIDRDDCAHLPVHYSSYANEAAAVGLFHMDQLFPDLAAQQLSWCVNQAERFNASLRTLDGIFLTGGDQARLLESFVSRDERGAYTRISPQLEILRERYAAGRLVVAGSSAGNAAQVGGQWRGVTVPMISGGDSWQTLAQGFMPGGGPTEGSARIGVGYADGGLGFFRFGPLDSHFSIRSREGRLLRFVKENRMDYGFGVDENTALVVSRPDAAGATLLRVVGAAGVFIVDARPAQASTLANGNYRLNSARIHYLTAGDTARIDAAGDLSISLATAKPLLAATPGVPPVNQTSVQQPGTFNFLKMTQAMGRSGASRAFGTTESALDGADAGRDLPHYGLSLARTAASEFRAAANGNVSYAHLDISLKPCTAGSCLAENGHEAASSSQGSALSTDKDK